MGKSDKLVSSYFLYNVGVMQKINLVKSSFGKINPRQDNLC
nr:hypothetical protein NFEMFJFI_00021 [Oryctes rhinoceros nudivirus]